MKPPSIDGADLVNMTAHARRLLHAVRDRHVALSREDEQNLCVLRLTLQQTAELGTIAAIAALPEKMPA